MIFDDLNVIVEWAEKLAKKHQMTVQQRDFNSVMRALYDLGQKGQGSIGLAQIQKLGLTKMQIFNAVEEAERRDMILDCGHLTDMSRWALKAKGRLYVEGLLEEEV